MRKFVGALPLCLAVFACAGKSLRVGESAPLKDKAGKVFGTRYQLADKSERLVIDADQNGVPEKQYVFADEVLTSSEHFYPDGKIRVRTLYLRGNANRSEVYRPDGSLQGVAYHNGQDGVDAVDLPGKKRRVEFLPTR
jgi:hypothetical protein